jgi:hypothetical protein
VSDRPVRVILDASAIVAYARGSIDVGETIAEVDDEYAAAGLPVLCLVEATRAVTDPDRLTLLVSHPATAVVVPEVTSWQALAASYDRVGRLDAATAVLAAVSNGCLILTSQPGLYGGLAEGGPIIPFRP